MRVKKIIGTIYVKDDSVYLDEQLKTPAGVTALEYARSGEHRGMDGLIFMDLSHDDASHEKTIGTLREICRSVDIPVYAGGNVNRVEDVKKYLYAGSRMAILDSRRESNILMTKEVSERFGKEKIGMFLRSNDSDVIQVAEDSRIAMLMVELDAESILASALVSKVPVLGVSKPARGNFLMHENSYGITGTEISKADTDIVELKEYYKNMGARMNCFEPALPFSEFKLNSDGMIPVVVQDYKTDEVLMVAYMNEEAYHLTIRTGLMTYYSRSRREIWVKGLTSGHFQYVMSMDIDCDNDTLLAHVKQVGAACHTGNHSCFYRNLVSREDVAKTNPLKVFTDVMNVILDRREHPKEGSYTNYLLDKGIDKILKKCGEEATEIVIAAKNPDPEEIRYEISDFLYHVMVLMAVKDVTWEDIIKELANR